jgi:hypothetical protein
MPEVESPFMHILKSLKDRILGGTSVVNPTSSPSPKIAAVISRPDEPPGGGKELEEGTYSGYLTGRTDANNPSHREYVLTLDGSDYSGKEIVISPDQLTAYSLLDPGDIVQPIRFQVSKAKAEGSIAKIDSITPRPITRVGFPETPLEVGRVSRTDEPGGVASRSEFPNPNRSTIYPAVIWRTFLSPKPAINFPHGEVTRDLKNLTRGSNNTDGTQTVQSRKRVLPQDGQNRAAPISGRIFKFFNKKKSDYHKAPSHLSHTQPSEPSSKKKFKQSGAQPEALRKTVVIFASKEIQRLSHQTLSTDGSLADPENSLGACARLSEFGDSTAVRQVSAHGYERPLFPVYEDANGEEKARARLLPLRLEQLQERLNTNKSISAADLVEFLRYGMTDDNMRGEISAYDQYLRTPKDASARPLRGLVDSTPERFAAWKRLQTDYQKGVEAAFTLGETLRNADGTSYLSRKMLYQDALINVTVQPETELHDLLKEKIDGVPKEFNRPLVLAWNPKLYLDFHEEKTNDFSLPERQQSFLIQIQKQGKISEISFVPSQDLSNHPAWKEVSERLRDSYGSSFRRTMKPPRGSIFDLFDIQKQESQGLPEVAGNIDIIHALIRPPAEGNALPQEWPDNKYARGYFSTGPKLNGKDQRPALRVEKISQCQPMDSDALHAKIPDSALSESGVDSSIPVEVFGFRLTSHHGGELDIFVNDGKLRRILSEASKVPGQYWEFIPPSTNNHVWTKTKEKDEYQYYYSKGRDLIRYRYQAERLVWAFQKETGEWSDLCQWIRPPWPADQQLYDHVIPREYSQGKWATTEGDKDSIASELQRDPKDHVRSRTTAFRASPTSARAERTKPVSRTSIGRTVRT